MKIVYSAVRTGSLNKADLRTNSDLCHLQHKLIGFYNRDENVYSAVRTESLNKADLRTNSDLCHLRHKLIGSYNRDEKCLQRSTDWVFKLSRSENKQ